MKEEKTISGRDIKHVYEMNRLLKEKEKEEVLFLKNIENKFF